MGGRKRHFKGNTRAEDKKVRRDREEEWKAAAPSAPAADGDTGVGRGAWTTEFKNEK
jgi:L-aminopeptidase/D-esterase-like protein